MLDIKIISILLEKINENLNEFYDYVNSNIRKDINIKENLDFLEEENLINKEIKYSISGDIFYANSLHLTSKGLKILNDIKNGNINNLEALYDFNNDNINVSIENNPVFNNNQNINVSPTFNNTNNVSNENNNISNIKTYSDLRLFVENNSNIENKTEIVNLIRELEEAKDDENKEDYIDKFLKLLELLENVLPIPPAIIKCAKTAKKFFDAIKNKNND